jgi:hypothetical protein
MKGEYENAIKEFTAVLKSGPNDTWHHVWFRRELAYYYTYRGKDSFKTYNYDEDLCNRTKHGMSQHESFTVPSEADYKSYRLFVEEKIAKENEEKADNKEKKKENDDNGINETNNIDRDEAEQLKKIEFMVKSTSGIAKLIQLDHPGFIPNQRQYRQFGLSVLQITQSLKEHISLLYEGKVRVHSVYLYLFCVSCDCGV